MLQARLDSSRLPGKALAELCGEGLLYRAMEALARVECGVRVLATVADAEDAFRPLAERAGFELHVGPKDDVLARFCGAIRAFGIDSLIRATGDNPFVSWEHATSIAALREAEGLDYAAYDGLPLGCGVEAVAAGALLEAEASAPDAYEREHVCPFLYRRPERFKVARPRLAVDPAISSRRLTVDTAEDLERARRVYAAWLEEGARDFGSLQRALGRTGDV